MAPGRSRNQRSRQTSRSRSSRSDVADAGNPSSPSIIEPSHDDWQNAQMLDNESDNFAPIRRMGSAVSDQLYISDGPLRRHGSSQRGPTADHMSSNVRATIEEQSAEGETRSYIWGTRICLGEVDAAFKRFLKEFQIEEETATDLSPSHLGYYGRALADAVGSQTGVLELDLQHVKCYDEVLYHQIVNYPNDLLTFLDYSVNDYAKSEIAGFEDSFEVQIKPFNVDRTLSMKMLEPDDLHKLVSVEGMVIRATSVIPEMREACFECSICNHVVTAVVNLGQIVEPTLCTNCQARNAFTLVANKSLFTDRQIVKLQEFPDKVPPGQAPLAVTIYLLGNLVDVVMPGDRVNVTGVYRSEPVRERPNQRTLRAVLRSFIDAIHVCKLEKNKMKNEDDVSWMKQERVDQIKELSSRPDVYERLAHALGVQLGDARERGFNCAVVLAPAIYGHDDIKQALLYLLFAGTRKDFSVIGVGASRAEMNILLCGDPGTAKSQMLQRVYKLLPRGQYVSGKGTSAAGLTAHVTRDLETNHFVLQIGALALSDNGICCIDEFDKMPDHTRSVLQEVMEQQTLSVAKAGIVCQLNARASILAAANPIESQWNARKTILENVQLPHTLLSRFDLIFLMVDPQEESYDRKLANHLVSMYFKSEPDSEDELADTGLLKDYILYAKATCHPIMNRAASANLIEKYVKMRQGKSSTGQISAYPRQLESLIRLSEARAKVRLVNEVTEEDVEQAYALYREALKQAATDPATGKVDVNILALGVSSATRRTAMEVKELIKANLLNKGEGAWVALKALLAEIREKAARTIKRDTFEEAVNEMCKDDMLFRGRQGKVSLNKRLAMQSTDVEVL